MRGSPLCAVFAALLALPALAQRTPDVLIGAASRTGYPWAPAQVSAAGRHAYAIWSDGDVQFSRSTDGGRSWAPQVQLNPSTYPTGGVDISSEGSDVYAVWVGDTVYFRHSADHGVSWGAVVEVEHHSPPPWRPRLATSGNRIYVVWQSGVPIGELVYFNRSLDGGATWLANDVRLDSTSGAFDPRIACSGSNVYVVWQDAQYNWQVRFNRSTDAGATWLPIDIRVDSGTGEARWPDLRCSGSEVYVVWEENPSGAYDIHFNRSLDAGTTWLASNLRLDTDGAGVAHSQLPAIDNVGNAIHVAWQDGRNGSTDIYFNRSTDGGATWLASDLRLDTDVAGAAASEKPRLASEGSLIHVVWQDRRSGSPDIHFNRSLDGGATWLASDRRLDTDVAGAATSERPQVASSAGHVHAIWEDQRSGSIEVRGNIPHGLLAYGGGTPGSGNVTPELIGTGFPFLGGTCSLLAHSGLGGASGIMLAGSRTSFPLLGGTVLVLPVLSVPVVLGGPSGLPGVGHGDLPILLPSDPVLVGGVVAFQLLILDAGASVGVSMTNGVELWIG